MKAISPSSVKRQLEKSFQAYANCHVILTNYKEDRQIDIIKNQDSYVYRENGFERIYRKHLNKAKILHLLQKQIRVEFGNSRKIHFSVK